MSGVVEGSDISRQVVLSIWLQCFEERVKGVVV